MSGPAPNGPFAYAGFVYYDGRGRDHDVFTFSADGKISRFLREAGRYHIDADCTETETDTAPGLGTQHYTQFVSSDGSQFTFIQADAGIVSAGTGIRTGNAQSGN